MKHFSFISGIVIASIVGGGFYFIGSEASNNPHQDSYSKSHNDAQPSSTETGSYSSRQTVSSSTEVIPEPQESRLEEEQLESDETPATNFFTSTSRSGNNQSRFKVQLLNANKDAEIDTTAKIAQQSPSLLNYGFKRTKNVYPGIDVVEYVDGGKIDYDFHVSPHGNISDIEMRFSESSTVTMDSEGNLLVTASNGTTSHVSRPRVWQENDGQRQVLNSQYVVNSSVVSIDVPNYNSNKTIVID